MKYFLFDLDGTLTDPAEGITNSVKYALSKFGIQTADRRTLYRFIGPPLISSFEEFYGFSRADAERCLGYYREYFAPHGIFENKLYPGIPELLDALRGAGKTLLVATSKPEEYAIEILRRFSIDRCFSAVCGNTLDEARPTKREVIEYAKTLFPDMSGENAVMIGDRKYDVAGAHACGIGAVGVLFGYGSRAELEAAGAEHIAADVGALGKILTEL